MKTATLPNKLSPSTSTHPNNSSALQIRRVLLPLDFSAASLDSLEFALPLMKRFRSEAHMVHVFEPDLPLTATAAMPLVIPEIQVGRRVHRHLKNVASEYGIALRRENIYCPRGRPFEEICRLARDAEIDLIVIASRGNTGLKHLMLGSTAERVVRFSSCPVLVVRQRNKGRRRKDHDYKSEVRFQRIIVPTDFSACSLRALQFAKAFAKEFKAKLILVNVLTLHYYVASDEYARYDLPLVREQTERISRQQMDDLIHKTDWSGIRVESTLQSGHAGEQICVQAEARRADLIITSTHGWTGLKHVWIGSTAEYVLRHAPCPVLVIPSRRSRSLD